MAIGEVHALAAQDGVADQRPGAETSSRARRLRLQIDTNRDREGKPLVNLLKA